MTSRRRSDDDGTILLLVLGFAAVLLLLVAIVVDVSAVILAQRAAASAADGAAVAAAQQLDPAVVYRHGLAGDIPLSPDGVQRAVADYGSTAAEDQPGLQLSALLDDSSTTATVTATRSVRLPFAGWLGVRAVQVTAVAHARAPLVKP